MAESTKFITHDNHNINVNDHDNNTESTIPPTQYMWLIIYLISSQSFIYGYSFAALNPCLALGSATDGHECYHTNDSHLCPPGSIYRDMELSSLQISLSNALLVIGGWFGAVISNIPSDYFGRRKTILFTAMLFVIGSCFTIINKLTCLYVGRSLIGIGLGIVSCVVPILLSEIAPKHLRGTITTMYQMMLTLGILFVSVVGYFMIEYLPQGWQYVMGFQLIPSSLPIIFINHIPESPKWLVRQNRTDEAVDILHLLRGDAIDLQAEMEEIEYEIHQGSKEQGTWRDVLQKKLALVIGCGLMMFQEFSGIDTVILYSTTIFGFAGFHQPILATASVGVVQFFTTVVAMQYVDRGGRKTMLISGMAIQMGSLAVIGAVLLLDNRDELIQGIVAVVAVLIFIFGYSIGLGAVVWVTMTEVVPQQIRDKAFSIFLNTSWASMLITSLGTLAAIDGLGGVDSSVDDEQQLQGQKNGVAYLYLILTGVNALGILFVYIFIPRDQHIIAGKSHALLRNTVGQ